MDAVGGDGPPSFPGSPFTGVILGWELETLGPNSASMVSGLLKVSVNHMSKWRKSCLGKAARESTS